MPERISRETIEREVRRTDPDYVVYVPGSFDEKAFDGLNEHFLVFDGPDGSLMAIWTQSPSAHGLRGGRQVNHICFSVSRDEGETWTDPQIVAGPRALDDPTRMASWAFPMVSGSGRIYVLWNQYQGVQAWQAMHCGTMSGCYSDDCGLTWSEPQDIPMALTEIDDPDGEVPAEWIVWQKPERDLRGKYLVGFSHWFHPEVAGMGLEEVRDWTDREAVSRFMRFVNIDENPEPRDLKIDFSPVSEGLGAPHGDFPALTNAHEPSIVRLPDDSLVCVMRTANGYLWWSGSRDDGARWSNTRPLLYRDFGRPLLNPCGSAPIFRLIDGRYVQLYHNNPGGKHRAMPRNPLYISVGEFRPDAEQPLEFGPPLKLMDTQGIAIDGCTEGESPLGLKGHNLSMYSSFTSRNGVDVLWYPDRKAFLLGKRLTPELVASLPGA